MDILQELLQNMVKSFLPVTGPQQVLTVYHGHKASRVHLHERLLCSTLQPTAISPAPARKGFVPMVSGEKPHEDVDICYLVAIHKGTSLCLHCFLLSGDRYLRLDQLRGSTGSSQQTTYKSFGDMKP